MHLACCIIMRDIMHLTYVHLTVQLVYVTHGQTHLSTNIPKASTTSGIGLDKLRKKSTIHSFTEFTLHSQYKIKWQANEQHAGNQNMNLKQNLQITCKISRLFYDFYYDLQILAGQGLAGLISIRAL